MRASAAPPGTDRVYGRKMQVLVLGGTSFVGRVIVEDLLSRGHTPTLFNRGRTGAHLFPGVARLVGDRESGDYAALAGHRWDAVVDVVAYLPRHVEQAVAALGGHDGRYVFISTGMVYDHVAAAGEITEDSPRLAPHLDDEVLADETYGPLKVACEDSLLAHFGECLSVVRPGFVVGPHDRFDRLTYWVRKAVRQRAIAVPERLDRPVQLIDVRDLARLVTVLLERDLPGAFNAVGPSPAVTFFELVRACGDAELVQVAEGDRDFPLLFPDPAWDAMLRISNTAALTAGMPATPLEQTITDTRVWDLARGEPALAGGMSEQEESDAIRQARS
ncbi:MAG: NAD-dependent epimerase/dehydratase [Marmoricola sp.]|nr:NAD-dependent epimerase/dehydratase [Marmoricola sp.]